MKTRRASNLMRRSLLSAFGILLPTTVLSFDYSWTPSARSLMRIDDNIRGSSGDPESAWGFDVGGGINFKATDGELTSEIIPRVNIRRFVYGENLDADEYSVTLRNDWKQERYNLGLSFSYFRDSTLTQEATDTGLLNDVTDRNSLLLQPSFTFLISDTLSVQAGMTINDVSYIDAENTGLTDYLYFQGSTGLNYFWADNLRLFANFFASNFETPALRSNTRTYGGQAGAAYFWNETLETTGTVGWVSSEIDFFEQQLALIFIPFPQIVAVDVPRNGQTSGPIASAQIRKKFDSIVSTFDFSRQVSPSGRGSQTTSDRIALYIEKTLSERTTMWFNGIHEMRDAEGADIQGRSVQNLNRDYSELRGSAQYRLIKDWYLGFSYRFVHRQSTNLDVISKANGHSVFLTLDFSPAGRVFSTGY